MGAQTVIRKHKKSEGFTVVEIIVAVVLMSLAIISLTSVVQYLQYSQRTAFYLDEANRAARSKIAEYQNKDFSMITPGPVEDALLAKLPAGRSGTVSVATSGLPGGSLPDSSAGKRIDVTITYPFGTTVKNVTLTAYIEPPEPSL